MRTPHDGIRLTYNPKTGKMEKVEGFSFLGITHVTMPWNWFEICASLPRSETVFPVAGLICLQTDLKRSQRITLPRTALSRCGITGQALRRGGRVTMAPANHSNRRDPDVWHQFSKRYKNLVQNDSMLRVAVFTPHLLQMASV